MSDSISDLMFSDKGQVNMTTVMYSSVSVYLGGDYPRDSHRTLTTHAKDFDKFVGMGMLFSIILTL